MSHISYINLIPPKQKTQRKIDGDLNVSYKLHQSNSSSAGEATCTSSSFPDSPPRKLRRRLSVRLK